jgi:hypothetical protein
MSTTTHTDKAEIAGRKYATKFYAETAAKGKPSEPTDANLAETLKDCALRPRPEWFPSIRRVLANEYGITVCVEQIIRQGGASENVAAEVTATLKNRKTTELMDDYRATKRIGGEFASEVRRWITAELIDRIGREAVVAFEQRAANEAKERAIKARDARKGDVYVTRGSGLYVRREVMDVKTYRKGALVQLTCEDHTTLLLDADQSIVVERDEDDEPEFRRPYRNLDTSETMRKFTDEQHAAFDRLDAAAGRERAIMEKHAHGNAGVTYVDRREIVTFVYSVAPNGAVTIVSQPEPDPAAIARLTESMERDHPLDGNGLPTFTASERGLLAGTYPTAKTLAIAAVNDHMGDRVARRRLVHFPHASHPCPMCRHAGEKGGA